MGEMADYYNDLNEMACEEYHDPVPVNPEISIPKGGYPVDQSSMFVADKNHYHMRLNGIQYHDESDKSYHITWNERTFWIAKRICREVDFKNNTLLAYIPILTDILKKLD